jgi:hypothetical protein
MHLIASLQNLIAQCTVMDFIKTFTIAVENVRVFVCVYLNTAYNKSISQTNVNYSHLNHF